MTQPYVVSLEPDAARRLATHGGTMLLLDVPQGTVVGIDQQAFVVGPRFKGVKMLPPGPHFLSYRAMSATGDASFPTSVFLHLAPSQVVVRRWAADTEALTPLGDDEEEGRYAEGVRRFDFDAGLAPYDLGSYGLWAALSRYVSADLIARLSPAGGSISIMEEAGDPLLVAPSTPGERALAEQLAGGRAAAAQGGEQGGAGRCAAQKSSGSGADMDVDRPVPPAAAAISAGQPSSSGAAAAAAAPPAAAANRQGRCRYSRLERLFKPAGASAAELTRWNLDRSMQLEAVLAAQPHPGGSEARLLGELQYAFIAFVYGQSLEGFGQWKALLCLLLACTQAVVTRQQLFTSFVQVLHTQLRAGLTPDSSRPQQGLPGPAAPLGVPMVEELLPDSFLRRAFRAFFATLREEQHRLAQGLLAEAQALKQLLAANLGWNFDVKVRPHGAAVDDDNAEDDDSEQDDEDGPQVVEL